MRLIILIILIILVVGALPSWPYSAGWGYYPVGGTRDNPDHRPHSRLAWICLAAEDRRTQGRPIKNDPVAIAAGSFFWLMLCSLEATSSAATCARSRQPGNRAREREPALIGGALELRLRASHQEKKPEIAPCWRRPRADRRRRSPLIPCWRGHVSSLVSPVLARPRRYRSPRLKSDQKDRQSHLSCSPSPSPGGQRRCRRLCLAFRCFVQRRTESQMSSVPQKHSIDFNAGS